MPFAAQPNRVVGQGHDEHERAADRLDPEGRLLQPVNVKPHHPHEQAQARGDPGRVAAGEASQAERQPARREEEEAAAGERTTAAWRRVPELRAGAGVLRELDGSWGVGPSLQIQLPLFDQNQAEIARRDAEIARATARAAALRTAVGSEVRAARTRLLAARAIVTDDVDRIRSQIKLWIADPAVDVVITTGGTGFTGRDVTPEAVEPLFEKRMDGFSTLFLMVSYGKIGTSAIQTRATAGVAGATYIFCLPGSPGACKDAWDDILVHQLDYRYRPCNFVEIMPRLDEHLRRPKAQGATG